MTGRTALRRGALLAAAIAFLPMPAGATSDQNGSETDWRARTSVAQEWLDGRYADRWARTVTYDGPPIVLRFSAHNPGDASVVRDVFAPAFDVLKRMSNGRLIVEPTWGGSAHSLSDGWDALARGDTDMSACYASLEAQKRGFRLLTLLDLPNLFPNAAVATAVSERLYARYFRSDFARNGVLMARMKGTGPSQLFTRDPVAGLSDIAGARIASADGIQAQTITALGAQPAVMPSPDVRKALAAKEIEGVTITDAAADVYGLGATTRYELVADLGRTNLEYCPSPKFYERLPANLRPLLNAWLRGEAQAETQIFYGRDGAIARASYVAAGGRVSTLDDGHRREWEARTVEVETKAVDDMERDGLPARAFMRDVRKLVAHYASASENDLMREAIDRPVSDILP